MARTFRLVCAVLTMVLLATACGSGAKTEAGKTSGKYGAGVDLDVGGTKKVGTATAAPAAGGTSGGQTSTGQTGGSSGSSGGGFKPDISRKAQDGGSAGDNAFFFLNRQVPRLLIEIDAVAGNEPSRAAIALLQQRLTGVVDKPSGVQVLPTEIIPESHETWTQDMVVKAEAKYRDTHNSRDTASMYFLYVDGQPDRQGPIGVTYTGTSVVIYIQVIRGLATPVVGAEGIEKATVIHEAGHCLALVNQTYRSPRPHEDPAHRGHSNNKDSVMYWAVETVDVVRLLGGNSDPPNAFDKDDLADLADLKTGKLP